MMPKTVLRAAAAVATSVLVCAAGDDTLVSQKDREFSTTSLSLHAGDTVRFSNDDDVVHNISVREPGGTNRKGVIEKPGDKIAVTFDQVGAYMVYCLIHPKMRLSVQVQ